MSVFAAISGFFWARWMSVPYRWRRQLVIGVLLWAAFRIAAWRWGFEEVVAYLLIAVVATYVVAELGLRGVRPVYAWFYRQFMGQLLGILFAALLPVIVESWVRAYRLRTWEELFVALGTTSVVAYLWWVIRRAVFSPVSESQLQRARRQRRRRRRV